VVCSGFYIKAGEFSSALARFKHVISEKGADEVLRHLLMHQMHHRLELHGSDGEMYAIVALDVEPIKGMVQDTGLAVPYKSLLNHLKRIPDDVLLKCVFVEEQRGPSHILIESEYGRKTFYGITFHSYPKIAPFRCINIAIMNVGDFRDMLSQTVFAVDEGAESKLNGVYFHCLPDKTRFVATNRYILSMYEKVDVVFTKPKSVVVPTRVLQIFADAIKDASEEGNVLFYVSEGHILLVHRMFSLFSKCLGGDFPDYEKAIPKEVKYVASLEREELIKVIKQLEPFARRRKPRVDLTFGRNEVALSVESIAHRMRKTESVSCRYSGEEPICFAVSFNAKGLLRILENIKGERVVMKMAIGSRPIVILPESQDVKAHVLCLIAPVIVLG